MKKKQKSTLIHLFPLFPLPLSACLSHVLVPEAALLSLMSLPSARSPPSPTSPPPSSCPL